MKVQNALFLGSALMVVAGGTAPAQGEPQQAGTPGATVEISVGTRTTHQMSGGVGASWHTIIQRPVFHGGSAFGGSPPVIPRHENLWKDIEHHADWLGLKFIRAEMSWRQWQPERGRYTWDTPEMKILYRTLDWAQKHGCDVMLQMQILNVEWLAFPDYRDDPAWMGNSAPADLDAFADGWVTLLRELREKRGYTCIRWINTINEPDGAWWWWLPPEGPFNPKRIQYLAQAMDKMREALRKAAMPVKIMGPDFCGIPKGPISKEVWFPKVDDVDYHDYRTCFDWENPASFEGGGCRMSDTVALIALHRAETAAAGKGLFLTEVGSMIYGYKGDSPEPGRSHASLKDTELMVRALNAGVDGFSHWSFLNRGDEDGQWQLVDTWDRALKIWMGRAAPHRDSYYVLGLAMRHVPQHAQVLETTVAGGRLQDLSRVWSCALRSPRDGSLTVLIVNDAQQPWKAKLALPVAGKPFVRLSSVPGAAPAQTLNYAPVATQAGTGTLDLPAFSLTVVTDAPLPTDGPGRF